jgi:hypothetical protein
MKSSLTLTEAKQLRDGLLQKLRSERVRGVDAVAISGGKGGMPILVVDVNELYQGGVPESYEGIAVETINIGEAAMCQ